MYSPQELFIRRIDELRQILANPSETNLFDAAPKLRQLLLDGDPLMNQANREIRDKFWFIVTALTARPNPDHPAAQGAVFSQIADGIAPNPAFPMLPQKRINRDEFLRLEVLYHEGRAATVHEVIDYVCHYAGAVHKATPDSPETKSIEAAAINFGVGGMPSVLRGLTGIIQVVITACEPLYQKLRV